MRKQFLPIFALLVALPAAANITGVVINSDGQAVAGAKVSIFAPESVAAHRLRLVSATPDRTPIASVTTDSKGTFNFESPKGQQVVDVAIEASGYAPDAMRLLADDDAGAIALLAAPMQRGAITANGKPVAGATVVWFGNGTDFMATTDAQGHYSVPDPSKWANRIVVVHPDYAMVDDVVPFRTTPKLDRALTAGVAISGRVVGADGTSAVAKAPILIDDFPLATTNDDGTFTIAHAPSNWQELQARSGNLAGVRAHAATSSVTIRLAKIATISGSVRDAKSQASIANAEVQLGPEMQSFGRRMRGFLTGGAPVVESVLTDAKGNFTIAAPAGRYTLSAMYPNMQIAPSQISLTTGQSVSKTIYAAQRARVTGTVVDEDRRPVAGARLTADARRGGGGAAFFLAPGRPQQATATYSAPDGRFVLRNVQTDVDVTVAAAKKGFPSAETASMRLAAGEKKSGVLLTIPRGVALTGKVTDANGRAISGVAVQPVESQGGGRGMFVRRVVNMLARDRDDDLVRTGSDGAFVLRVKPGTYDVAFKREGFASRVIHGATVDAAARPLEVKLDPSVEITGRVVRNGAGVEGVNVNAISEDGSATAITGPDGSFTVTDLTPGQLMLNVMKPDAFIQQVRSVNAPARDVVIELPAGGRITGRVVDKSTHNPVPSFQAGIAFTRGAGGMVIALPPMLKDFTSDDGTFTLENVPSGPTQLVVNAPGYTQAKVPGLNVQDGKTLDNVEVDLETGARLTGRVTGPDGNPVVGAQVGEAMSGPRFNTAPPIVTDANGEYTIDNLEPGQKTFTFAHQGFVSVDKSVTLTSGQDARLDAQLSSGLTISGTVVTDAGAPVPNAAVNANSASNSMFGNLTAHTDAGGTFQMTGLTPGHYSFFARADNVGSGTLRDFDIASGGAPRIVIPAGGTIVGHVSGLTASELSNTIIIATGPNGSTNAEPDSSGAYRIDGAPTGTVHVMARTGRGMGPGAGRTSGTVSLQVDAGSTATADIVFKSATVVQGRVTLNGQPMSNVIVTFNPRMGATTSSNGTTDGNGNYSITGLDDGTYNVGVINIDRSNAFTSTYEVHGSGNFDIAIKTISVQGTVVDSSSGQPIANAVVQLQKEGGGFLGSQVINSDPSGAFLAENVAAGSYHVVVQKEGYGQATRDIAVTDSPLDPLQFKLSASDGITINVVDARDQTPLRANATRIVDNASGQPVQQGGPMFFGAGAPGPLKLSLAPGSYTVTITAQGYANKIVTVTSPSQITVGLTSGATVVFRSKSSARVTARLVEPNGSIYRTFLLDASPLTTTINGVAGGNYTLQVLDSAGAVINSMPITVVDGQPNAFDV